MSLTWDLTEIANYQDLCWIENTSPNKKEGENYALNPVTDALIHLSSFTGIPKITPKNYKELSKRLVELEIVGIAVLPQEPVGDVWEDDNHMPSRMMRNPRLEEVQSHIGLQTNVTPLESKKWGNTIRRIVREQAEEFLTTYATKDADNDGVLQQSDEQSDGSGDERVS